jgi:flagellar protein FliL
MADQTNIAVEAGEAPAETAEPKKSKLVPLLIGLGLLVLLGGGGTAWFLMHRAKPAEAAVVVETAPAFTQHLEGFTVNLADLEENHFLRVTMDLGLGHAADAQGKDKGADGFPTARVRDAILPVLTAGKADTLMTPDGKAQLKKDIVEALKEKVPEIDAREVYFTEFLVQR